jgi:hypothetical protein
VRYLLPWETGPPAGIFISGATTTRFALILDVGKFHVVFSGLGFIEGQTGIVHSTGVLTGFILKGRDGEFLRHLETKRYECAVRGGVGYYM